MSSDTINLRDIKEQRLERHWSQHQLAEMSGLSVRTIQRIERGENAGLETLKSLAAVFETNIVDADKDLEIERVKEEQAYVQNVKGFYKLFAIAIFSLIVPFILAIKGSFNWVSFLLIMLSWMVLITIYSLNVFDFFGDKWKNKLIENKFKKK